jgi:hypothetical protein
LLDEINSGNYSLKKHKKEVKMGRLKKMMCLFVITGCLSAQTLRWIYTPRGYVSAHYGSAHSVIYGQDGNIYAVGGAPGAGKGITFEKTYGALGIDEVGRSGQQTSDNGYVILGNIGSTSPITKINNVIIKK